MVKRRRRRERGQVMCACLGGRLEARGKPDQRGLTERCAEEADAERHTGHHARRDLDDGISGARSKTRYPENEVVAINQVGSPRRIVIMMGYPGLNYKNPKRLGQATQSLYVNVDDVDEHFERARKAGATILEDPKDTFYGDRRYGAEEIPKDISGTSRRRSVNVKNPK